MRFLSTLLLAVTVCAQQPKFENGLPTDPAFFPVGVWLQSPHNAQRYADLGVNLYVGLFGGPTAAQLDALERVGMRTICAQNEVGLAHAGKVIVGWMHDDEPDNAQPATVSRGAPLGGTRSPAHSPTWSVSGPAVSSVLLTTSAS